jgi:hypothetical protein
MKRPLAISPSTPRAAARVVATSLEANVKRAGAYSARPSCPPPESSAPKPKSTEILLRLQLSREELSRLDQASRDTRYSRNGWVAALVRKALCGRPQPASRDRVSISGLVKALRKIEATSQRSARALADLEATARDCLARCAEVERFHEQVRDMANALDQVFKGNDAYWRAVIEQGGVDGVNAVSAPGSTDEPSGRRRRA